MSIIRASRNKAAASCARRNGKKQDRRIHLPDPVVPSAYFRWKRLLDATLAAVLLVPCLPLVGALVLLVRLTSRGPGLYRQSRVGKDGRPFKLYKIRTMRHDAEARTGAVWSGPGDARVTGVGAILRKFHLDEFPQLFNVLKGEMSLVGPRPERPEFVHALSTAVPGYRSRLRVLPGITGLAQLNLPPDTTLCSVCRKVVLDLDYIQHAGVLLDLRLLCCTFARVFKLPNAVTVRPLGLAREVRIRDCHTESGNGETGTEVTDKGCPASKRLGKIMDDVEVEVPLAVAVPSESPQRLPRIVALNSPNAADPEPTVRIVNCLTVDVEDYYMVSGFEKQIPRARWGEMESRVAANTTRLLRLLDRHDVKATFFILGWVARHYPELVREIHASGHEIASHGYWHHLVYRQTPEEFRNDLRASRDAIEDIVDQPVSIYRAPSFSITEESRWALDILTEEGFRIDSSIYPIHHDRYGIADAEPGIHQIPTPSGPLWEFPPSVVSWKGINLPVGGGGYFRLYPLKLTIRWLEKINRDRHRPFMFYVHSWEVDPEQPRIRNGSRLSQFRHYVNLSRTERRLETILDHFQFGPVGEIVPREWGPGDEQQKGASEPECPANRVLPSDASIAPSRTSE